MKLTKFIALAAVAIFTLNAHAQNIEKWAELQSVENVITRIDTNIKAGNNGLVRFAKTLKHSTDQLAQQPIPSEMKSDKVNKAVDNLKKATDNLDALVDKKAATTTLNAAFNDVAVKYAELKKLLK